MEHSITAAAGVVPGCVGSAIVAGKPKRTVQFTLS